MTILSTVADLIAHLGVPPDRIRLHPPPGTATEADVIAIEAKENRLFELVDGVLVEKAMGLRESLLAGWILTALNVFVLPRRLGVVSGADGAMRLFPGLVRIPDVAFVSTAGLAGAKVASEPIPSVVPEFAVEVLSSSNTQREMERKRDEYFDAGVRLVWIVDPDARTVAVFTSPAAPALFTEGQTIDGGDVLPGFTLPLAELFSKLDLLE